MDLVPPRTTTLNKRSEKQQVNSFLLLLQFAKSRFRRQTVASLCLLIGHWWRLQADSNCCSGLAGLAEALTTRV